MEMSIEEFSPHYCCSRRCFVIYDVQFRNKHFLGGQQSLVNVCRQLQQIEYYTATHCNTLQHTATHCNTLQHNATHCNTMQHAATQNVYLPVVAANQAIHRNSATHCNTLQHTPTYCNTLQHTSTLLQRDEHHTENLQHTATHCSTQRVPASCCSESRPTQEHCNTLQHTATHYNILQHSATHCNTQRVPASCCSEASSCCRPPRYNTLQHTATHCNTLQHTEHIATHNVYQQVVAVKRALVAGHLESLCLHQFPIAAPKPPHAHVLETV